MPKTLDSTLQHGLNGGTYYNDTSPHTGKWYALVAVGGNATMSAITSNITSLPAAHVITQDTSLDAKVTAFTLASGAVIAYDELDN